MNHPHPTLSGAVTRPVAILSRPVRILAPVYRRCVHVPLRPASRRAVLATAVQTVLVALTLGACSDGGGADGVPDDGLPNDSAARANATPGGPDGSVEESDADRGTARDGGAEDGGADDGAADDAQSSPGAADGTGEQSESSSRPTPATALRFADVTDEVGVSFQHHAGYTAERYAPENMGGGVVLSDVDRDGDPDLLLLDSGVLRGGVGEDDVPAGSGPRLFLNDGGKFEDVTAAWGLGGLVADGLGYGMGAAAGDIDGDGFPDLYLATYGEGERVLRNTGSGFEDVTAASGIEDDGAWTSSAAFLDIDQDGDLDLWQVRYTDYDVATAVRCYHTGVHVHCGPDISYAVPDRLWANDGTGRFSDVSEAAGLSSEPPGKGLALVAGDVDLDGDIDVYVANDQTRNHLWLGDGAGHFEETGRLAAVAYSNIGAEEAGMGADLSDLDGDGRQDLIVPNFQGESVSLYLQTAPLFFREDSDALGIGMTARARLGFGVDAFDADNDGDEDIYVANGHLNDNAGDLGSGLTFAQPDTLYENQGGRFVDVTAAAGPGIAEPGVHRGVATGDLDGDGRLDVVVAANNAAPRVLRNVGTPAGSFLGLWLEGTRANRSAVGAVVTATIGARTIVRQVVGAGSYLSASDPRIHIGLGDARDLDSLVVRWPGGATETAPAEALTPGVWLRWVEGTPPERFTPGAWRPSE